MYEECPALLQMTRTFLEDGEKDEIIHHCKVIRYDSEEENIYLIAGKSDITSFLLDGVYRCTINSEKKRNLVPGQSYVKDTVIKSEKS